MPETKENLKQRIEELENELSGIYDSIGSLLGSEEDGEDE